MNQITTPDEIAEYYGFETFESWIHAVEKHGEDISHARINEDGTVTITGWAWTEGSYDPEFAETITFPTSGQHIDELRQHIENAITDWYIDNEDPNDRWEVTA